MEPPDHLRGARHNTVHDARIKEIPLADGIFDQPPLHCIIQHGLQNGGRGVQLLLHRLRLKRIRLQDVQQEIRRIVKIVFIDKSVLLRKMQQPVDFCLD